MDSNDQRIVERLRGVGKSLHDEKLSEKQKSDLKLEIHRRINGEPVDRQTRVRSKFWVNGGVAIAGVALVLAGFTAVYDKGLTNNKHPKYITTHTIITLDDSRIGNLKLGEKLSQIAQEYGDPSSQQNGPEITWKYNDKGFSVVGSHVWLITVTKGFLSQTPRGIRIGSLKSVVERAYYGLRQINGNNLYGLSNNDQFAIDFTFTGQKVSKITLYDLSNGRFWEPQINPGLYSSMVSSIEGNEIRIDPLIARNGISTIMISKGTLIWDNGRLVPYRKSPGLKAGQAFDAIVKQVGKRTSANVIYGPMSGVISGTITQISGNTLTLKELYNPTSTTWKPTGRVLTLEYDSRTLFRSPVVLLKRGVFVQLTAFGFYPGRLLMQGITAYKLSKLPGGGYNFIQIR